MKVHLLAVWCVSTVSCSRIRTKDSLQEQIATDDNGDTRLSIPDSADDSAWYSAWFPSLSSVIEPVETVLYRDMPVPSAAETVQWEAALRAVPDQGSADVSFEVDLTTRFAALAYGRNADVPLLASLVSPSILEVQFHSSEDSQEGAHVVAYLYKVSQGEVGVVLCYKGSTGTSDWLHNFQMFSTEGSSVELGVPLFSEEASLEGLDQTARKATVHPGFFAYKGSLDARMQHWDMSSISQVFNEWGVPLGPDFLSWMRAGHWRWCVMVGHSLGGGMAPIAATDLAIRTGRQVLLSTLAAPTSGDLAFVETQNSHVGPNGGLRIFNHYDLVPKVGSLDALANMYDGNAHGGQAVMLNGYRTPLNAHILYTVPSRMRGEVAWTVVTFPGVSYTAKAQVMESCAVGSLRPPSSLPETISLSDLPIPSLAQAESWHASIQRANHSCPTGLHTAIDVAARYALLSYAPNDGALPGVARLGEGLVQVRFHDVLGLELAVYIYRLSQGGVAVVLSFKDLTGAEVAHSDSEIDSDGRLIFEDREGFDDRLADAAPRLVDIVRHAKVHSEFAEKKAKLDQHMRAWDMLPLALVLREWGLSAAEPNFLAWLHAGHWRWSAAVGQGSGGALAAIAVVELGVLTGQQPILATLGSPASGNTAFARAQNELASPGGGLRIFNEQDEVPGFDSDVRHHAGHPVELTALALDDASCSAHHKYTLLSDVSGQASWVRFVFQGCEDLFVSKTGTRLTKKPWMWPTGYGYRQTPIPAPAEVEAWEISLAQNSFIGEVDVTSHVDLALRFALLAQGRNSGDRSRVTKLSSLESQFQSTETHDSARSVDVVELQFHSTETYDSGTHLVVYLYKLQAGGVGVVLSYKDLTGSEAYAEGMQHVLGADRIVHDGHPLLKEGQGPAQTLPLGVQREARQAKVRRDLTELKAALDGSMLSLDMSSLTPLLETWGVGAVTDFRTWLMEGQWSWCIFVGHGLGGSLAALAATEIGIITGRRPLLATVASPRVGDEAFESARRGCTGPSAGGLNIFNRQDITPDVKSEHPTSLNVVLDSYSFDHEPWTAHTRFLVPSTVGGGNLHWVRFMFEKKPFGYSPDMSEEAGSGLFTNFIAVTPS